jgi:hypothetical protein
MVVVTTREAAVLVAHCRNSDRRVVASNGVNGCGRRSTWFWSICGVMRCAANPVFLDNERQFLGIGLNDARPMVLSSEAIASSKHQIHALGVMVSLAVQK